MRKASVIRPKTEVRNSRFQITKSKATVKTDSSHHVSKLPIRLPRKKLELFCKKHHIFYMALFGSILTDKFRKKSDIDFLVKFDQEHMPTLFSIGTIENELAEIMKRRVDLKTPLGLSRFFRDEVLAKAKIIYER
ncbi:MAG TPA: nucleotidyltransferase domain-containing protein [Chlamydiales bacterium]|nr:nucleotidyltransferase domain-containing protein [Chlamydiales bacterium]